MRAILLKSINLDEEKFIIEGNKFHHLKNVVRIKVGSQIKILNSLNEYVIAEVSEVTKKNILCKKISSEVVKDKIEDDITVAFGLVKKEALEICIKSCVELACREIIILNTEFSQRYELKEERISQILESAVEQSNLTFLPTTKILDLNELNLEKYENIILASMSESSKSNKLQGSSCILLIGPEGGFSERELQNINHTLDIHIKGGILRTQTAIPAMVGFVKSLL